MLAVTTARILFGLFFLGSAILKIVETEVLAGMLAEAGFLTPEPLVYIAAFAQALAGGALILGYNIREACLGLILYVAVVNWFIHPFWALEGESASIQFQLFTKNLGIMAGLLAIAGVHWRDYPFKRTVLPGRTSDTPEGAPGHAGGKREEIRA